MYSTVLINVFVSLSGKCCDQCYCVPLRLWRSQHHLQYLARSVTQLQQPVRRRLRHRALTGPRPSSGLLLPGPDLLEKVTVLHTPQLKCEIIHPNIQPLVTMIPASCSCLFFFYIRMIYYLTRSSSFMSLFLSVSSSLFLFHVSFPLFFFIHDF